MKFRTSAFLLSCFLATRVFAQTGSAPVPPPPRGDVARMTFDGWWVTDVFFEQSSSRLPAEQRQKLIALAARPQDLLEFKRPWCKESTWYVHGIADSTEGSAEKRKQLSLQRAEYVASLIQSYGVPRTHICISSRRTDIPLPQSKVKNSRAEIELRCGPPPTQTQGC